MKHYKNFLDGKVIYSLDKLSFDRLYAELNQENTYTSNEIVLNEGDCVFDIGANIGMFSIMLNKENKSLKIFTFEPIPQIYECLRLNTENIENIVALNIGISDERSECEFDFLPNLAYCSNMTGLYEGTEDQTVKYILEQMEEQGGFYKYLPYPIRLYIVRVYVKRILFKSKKVRCKLDTISNIIMDNDVDKIDLLKVDAEGNEDKIFEGIDEKSWQKIRQIVLEAHCNTKEAQKYGKLFESKGFKTTKIVKNESFLDYSMVYARR